MDYKIGYSRGVELAKNDAMTEAALQKKISQGRVNKIRFTHKIMVPNHKSNVVTTVSYAEEMEDVSVFTLSQEEYDELRQEGGLFDLFDSTFGTIIDDCEEDRLSFDQVIQALEMTLRFANDPTSSIAPGLDKVIQSLEHAKRIGTFWEIVNGAELCESSAYTS